MTFDITPYRDLYPFESHFADRGGLRQHYVDEGQGDPVVMVHGNPTWSLYYRELVIALRSAYRVIAPDHIGCGLSDKPGDDLYSYRLADRIDDLEALLDGVGVQRNITLVVHDWGGVIGFGYAVRFPERVSRLIILNTAAFPPPPGKKLPWPLAIVRDLKPVGWLVLGLNAFCRVATHVACRSMSGHLRRAYLAPYDSWEHRIGVLRFVQDIPLRSSDPSYETLKSIHKGLHQLRGKPTLICWGERDFVFDDLILRQWKSELPDAEVHTFEDAGHYVLEDEGARISRLSQEFLERHPIGRDPA